MDDATKTSAPKPEDDLVELTPAEQEEFLLKYAKSKCKLCYGAGQFVEVVNGQRQGRVCTCVQKSYSKYLAAVALSGVRHNQ